jgi:hypothetical protein
MTATADGMLVSSDAGLVLYPDVGLPDTLRSVPTRRAVLDNSGRVVVGDINGVYRANEEGEWTEMYRARGDVFECVPGIVGVFTLLVRPDGAIVAGVGEEDVNSSGGCKYEGASVYMSHDDGQTWQRSLAAGDPPIRSTVFLGDSVGFASSQEPGLFATYDGGASWARVAFDSSRVVDVALVGSVVFVNIVRLESLPTGLYRSNSDGSWTLVSDGLGHITKVTSIGEEVLVGTLAGYIWSSSDLGVTWTNVGEGLPDSQVVQLVAGLDGYLYASLKAGAYRIQRTGSTQAEEPDQLVAVTFDPVYPNPFLDRTTMTYRVGEAGPVTISVYDVLGRLVKSVASNEYHAAGAYEKQFERGDLPTGTYFITIESADSRQARPMTIQ